MNHKAIATFLLLAVLLSLSLLLTLSLQAQKQGLAEHFSDVVFTVRGKGAPTSTPIASTTGPVVPASGLNTDPAAAAVVPVTCQELLVNRDFETGSLTPWQTWGNVGLGSGHNSIRFLTMATRTYTESAIQIWVFTAFSLVP